MRLLALLYGVLCYALFLAVFLYSIVFVGNLQPLIPELAAYLPRSIDAGGPKSPWLLALAIDMALLAIFGLQHSVMARPEFKAIWTRVLPQPIERSTYVLASSLALILLYWQWRPIAVVVWATEPASVSHSLLLGIFGFAWLFVLVSTFLIDHFSLFGLRQVASATAGQPAPSMTFRTPAFYRFVRHPIMLGFVIAFWAAPVMTVGHLVFAIATTAYIAIALHLEERDLVAEFGESYLEYRREVRMLVPWPMRARR
jgi:protein-S-isoprenylcysteine O-methyltransferase Ste14